jgi:hypothetical protein
MEGHVKQTRYQPSYEKCVIQHGIRRYGQKWSSKADQVNRLQLNFSSIHGCPRFHAKQLL